MTSDHDKLIDALIRASFSWQDADDTSTDVALIKELWEEVVAARKALVDYIEQRTLTAEEAATILKAADYYTLEPEWMFGPMTTVLAKLRAISEQPRNT